MKKSYDSKFKSHVALEASRGDQTITEIAGGSIRFIRIWSPKGSTSFKFADMVLVLLCGFEVARRYLDKYGEVGVETSFGPSGVCHEFLAGEDGTVHFEGT